MPRPSCLANAAQEGKLHQAAESCEDDCSPLSMPVTRNMAVQNLLETCPRVSPLHMQDMGVEGVDDA